MRKNEFGKRYKQLVNKIYKVIIKLLTGELFTHRKYLSIILLQNKHLIFRVYFNLT